MLQLLLLVPVLTAHLVCVALASAGPLVGVWLEWRQWRGDALAGRACRALSAASLALLAAGAVLGLVAGAILWSDAYRELLGRLTRQIRWGVWELLISAGLMVIYVAWRKANARPRRWAAIARMGLPLLAGTNLLYHLPVLFAVLHGAAWGEAPGAGPVDRAAFLRVLLEGGAAARCISFSAAAFAAVGAALIVLALRWVRQGEGEAARAAVWGGRIALAAALLEIPLAVWTLMSMPADAAYQALGGDLAASILACLACLAGLWWIHLLGAIAWGDTRARVLRTAVVLAIVVAVLATGASRRVQSLAPPPGWRTAQAGMLSPADGREAAALDSLAVVSSDPPPPGRPVRRSLVS